MCTVRLTSLSLLISSTDTSNMHAARLYRSIRRPIRLSAFCLSRSLPSDACCANLLIPVSSRSTKRFNIPFSFPARLTERHKTKLSSSPSGDLHSTTSTPGDTSSHVDSNSSCSNLFNIDLGVPTKYRALLLLKNSRLRSEERRVGKECIS